LEIDPKADKSARIIDIVSSSVSDRLISMNDLWWWFGAFVIVKFVYQALYRAGDFYIVTAQSETMKHLADQAFNDLQRHSYRFFSESFSGSLVAKAKRFVGNFEAMYDSIVFSFWMTLVQVAGMLVSLFVFAPSIAWFFFLFVVMYVWFSWWVMRMKTPYDEQSAEEDSQLTAKLSDVLSNILTVKTFSNEQKEKEAFAETSTLWEWARRKSWNFQNLAIAGQTILLGILEVASVGIALHLWLKGSITSGTVVMIQWYMAALFGSLFQLNRVFGKFIRSLAEASEMIEIFETPTEVEDAIAPKQLERVRGELALENLTFKYADGANVFEHLSVQFRAGEKVGIVGSSGAGKSTLTKLLLRFLDPNDGAVTIDGVDIRELAQSDVRRMIAYVPQEPALFHRSLRENIAYGKPEASMDEVIAAAKLAHAHEFIEKLSQGYETLVGERGVKLSGGERQRVAIARAILKDAPILILDEATSALDTVSEQYIQEALDTLMQGRTTLVIAHRLSTVRKMDRILVFAEGQVVEEGTHDQLVTKNGVYAGFWNRQTSGFAPQILIDSDEGDTGDADEFSGKQEV
jgi:ATP-binding cassette subfamily B protein